MASLSRSVTADASGNATVRFSDLPTGIQWIVWQTSVEVLPPAPLTQQTISGVSAYIRQNGRLVTSTRFGAFSAASGPPAITINPGDAFQVEWVGAPAGSSCIATLYYDEVQYGQRPTVQIV